MVKFTLKSDTFEHIYHSTQFGLDLKHMSVKIS